MTGISIMAWSDELPCWRPRARMPSAGMETYLCLLHHVQKFAEGQETTFGQVISGNHLGQFLIALDFILRVNVSINMDERVDLYLHNHPQVTGEGRRQNISYTHTAVHA